MTSIDVGCPVISSLCGSICGTRAGAQTTVGFSDQASLSGPHRIARHDA